MIVLIKSLTGGLHALPIRANSPQKAVRENHDTGGVIFVSPEGTKLDLTAEEIAELKGCAAVQIDAPAAAPQPPAGDTDEPDAKKKK